MDVKPIETVYKGYRFRSRLEARWAVFFDAYGVRWIYEHEGYELKLADGRVIRYLPDFYFPAYKMFGEVKGTDIWGGIPAEDAEKMSWMIDFNGPCANGIIMLGNIPNPGHDMIWAVWRWTGESIMRSYEKVYFPEGGTQNLREFDQDDDLDVCTMDQFSAPHVFDPEDDLVLTRALIRTKYDPFTHSSYNNPDAPKNETYCALEKARQARFEHGESPRLSGN